jgi:predicted nuclease with TOPRIM domain
MTLDISILIAIVGCAMALYGGIRGFRNDSKSDGRILEKLDTLMAYIAEIKSELCNVKHENKEFFERLVKVEESSKSAHKRLDEMTKGV